MAAEAGRSDTGRAAHRQRLPADRRLPHAALAQRTLLVRYDHVRRVPEGACVHQHRHGGLRPASPLPAVHAAGTNHPMPG